MGDKKFVSGNLSPPWVIGDKNEGTKNINDSQEFSLEELHIIGNGFHAIKAIVA